MPVAHDPNSLVDVLSSLGYGSTFASRKRLWGLYDLREAYTGSARQNTLLLSCIRIGEKAPTLRVTGNLYDLGQDVQAVVVADAKVIIENSFGGMSSEAVPGQTVTLGKLKYAGVFPIRIASGLAAGEGGLMVLPHPSGKLAVGYVATPVEYTTAPIPLAGELGDQSLLEKFYDAVTEEMIAKAWKATLVDIWKPDRVAGFSLDLLFGLLLSFVPVAGQLGFAVRMVPLGKSAIGWLFDSFHDFTDEIAAQVPNLSASEMTRLKQILAAPVFVAKLGLDLRGLRSERLLCEAYDRLAGTADNFFLKTLELDDSSNDSLKMTGSMLRDGTNKSIGFVCEIVKRSKP